MSGTLTSFVAAEFDLFILNGIAVAIASRDSGSKITLKQPWPGDSVTGASGWTIVNTGPYWQSSVTTNKQLATLLSKFEAGPVKWDASGPRSSRDAYNNQPVDFVYLSVDPLPFTLFVKRANTNSASDWSAGQVLQLKADSTVEAEAARDVAQGAAATAAGAAGSASASADLASSQAGAASGAASTATGAASTATSQAAASKTDADRSAASAVSAAQVAPNRTYAELIADTSPQVGTVRQVSTDPNSGTYELRLVGSAKTWVRTGATVPGLDFAVGQASLGSGELIDRNVLPSGAVFNGAQPVPGFGRPMIGFSAAPGSTGTDSFVTAFIRLTKEEVAANAGRQVALTVIFDATANFLVEKPFIALQGQVVRSGATSSMGTLTKLVQNGLKITKEIVYTLTAADDSIGVAARISSTSTANAHQITIASVSWRYVSAATTETGADTQFERRVRRSGPSIGPVIDTLIPMLQVNGGASRRAVNGRDSFGLGIPAGATGAGSVLQFRLNQSAAERALNAGKAVAVVMGFNTSANFTRTVSQVAQVILPNNSSRAPTFVPLRNIQVSPTRRIVEMQFTLQGDEASLIPYIAISGAAAASDEFIDLTDYSVRIVEGIGDALSAAEENQRIAHLRLIRDTQAAMSFIGSVFADTLITGDLSGGAVRRNGAGGAWAGYAVPQGQTGGNSSLRPALPVVSADRALLVGSTVRLTFALNVNVEFARTLVPTMQVQTLLGGSYFTRPSVRTAVLSPAANRRLIQIEYVVQGDELAFAPTIQNATAAVAPQADFIEITDFTLSVVSTPSDYRSVSDLASQVVQGRAVRQATLAAANGQSYARRVTVKPDGTGDYLTVKAAVAAITDASASNRVEVVVYPGTYTDVQYLMKDFVDITGTDRERCWLKGYQPPDTSLQLIRANSTIQMDTETTLRNLRITCQNMRYPVHSDSGGLLKDRRMRLIDCHLEHLDNEEARAYQASIGADPNAVWNSLHPWGYGSSSGMDWEAERCTFKSPQSAWYVHNNKDFDRPNINRMKNCLLLTTGAGTLPVIMVQNLGSGSGDVVELTGVQAIGDLAFNPLPWLTDNPALWIANRPHLQKITGHGNAPMPYVYQSDGSRALRIESASTAAGTAIAISGDAVPILFGDVVQDRSGGGLPGAVYGTWEVAGIATGAAGTTGLTLLGRRLGDCTGTNRTLTVRVNGGAPVNIVFNQDHTAQSNATVLGLINAVLGSAATASLMDVSERYRPQFTDEEVYVRNDGAEAIRRRRAVADAGGPLSVRPMTAADPASRFIGIALENIPPGEFGRVKRRGAVRVSFDMERADATSFVSGDTFGVGADGRWVKGATIPLVTAYSTNAVRWEPRY